MNRRPLLFVAMSGVFSAIAIAACANDGDDASALLSDAGAPPAPPSDGGRADETAVEGDASAEAGFVECNESGWCFTSPPHRAAFLEGVGGSGPNDVWAVGLSVDQLPIIIHWNGTTWSESWVGTQVGGALFAVWAPSKDEAWAVGNPGVMHYTAGAWTIVRTPTDDTVPDGVWGESADDFWVVGASGVTTGSPWGVQHAQRATDGGITWTSHVLGPDSYGASSVIGRTKDDVWVGSFQGLYHYLRGADGGSTWTTVETTGNIGNLWVGSDGGLVAGQQLRVAVEAGAASTYPLPHDDAGRYDTRYVWGTSASDLWFVGGSESATINHWDGTSVRFSHSLVNGAPVPGGLLAAWGSSSSDVWVVGAATYGAEARAIALHRVGP